MAFRHLRLRPFILRILYTILQLIYQMLIIMKITVFDLSAGSEQFFLPWGDHIRRQYSGILTFRNSDFSKFRNSDFPKFRLSEIPEFRKSKFRNSDSGILISIPECSGIPNTPTLELHISNTTNSTANEAWYHQTL